MSRIAPARLRSCRRRGPSLAASAVLALGAVAPVAAHHGWSWTADGDVEVTGVIESATLGNPHGVLILDVDGERWTAEVGQPWRNERAGLKDAMLAPGREITIDGERSADPAELRVKAERVIIDGVVHDLYPERD